MMGIMGFLGIMGNMGKLPHLPSNLIFQPEHLIAYGGQGCDYHIHQQQLYAGDVDMLHARPWH